jgi:thiamine phosphate synthase YjbQ (UPF0047 family)
MRIMEIAMLCAYDIQTPCEAFCDITPQVREVVSKSGVTDGVVIVYRCRHVVRQITDLGLYAPE